MSSVVRHRCRRAEGTSWSLSESNRTSASTLSACRTMKSREVVRLGPRGSRDYPVKSEEAALVTDEAMLPGEDRILRRELDDVAAQRLIDESTQAAARETRYEPFGHHIVPQTPVGLHGLQEWLRPREPGVVHDQVAASHTRPVTPERPPRHAPEDRTNRCVVRHDRCSRQNPRRVRPRSRRGSLRDWLGSHEKRLDRAHPGATPISRTGSPA